MSDGPVTVERLVWRHEHGYIGETALVLAFEEEAARLREEFAGLSGRLGVVRRWNGTLLHQFDAAHSAYYRALDGRLYRQAFRHFKSARRALDTVRDVLAGDAAISQATTEYARLQLLGADSQLRDLPSFTTPRGLLAAAEERLSRREYGQGALIAGACLRFVAPLLSRAAHGNSGQVTAEWIARRERLERIYADTLDYVPDQTVDPLCEDVLRVLSRLMSDGWTTLAVRLIGELELSIAARSRFARVTQDTPGELLASLRHELTGIVKNGSWAAATDRVFQVLVAESSRELTRQLQNAESAIGVWNGESDR